jgi:murein DD-endopeptidase MepM/ murein hydrolase activator NlpD
MSPIIRVRVAGSAVLLLFGLGLLAFPGRSALAGGVFYVRPLNGDAILRFGRVYNDLSTGKKHTHHGLDIGAAAGTRVAAAADGLVVFAGHTPLGNCVSIRHADGVKTTYLPLGKVAVGQGDEVPQGRLIGYVASGGDCSSTAPHLHLGAVFAGDYLDPESLFKGEFRPDYSKLIRRGDLPPDESGNTLTGFGLLGKAAPQSWWARLWD